MRGDAIRPGDIVVHGAVAVELDANKATDRPLELERIRSDDVDACVRAISEIVFGPAGIYPADVERPKGTARNLNGGKSFCLRVGRCSKPRAGSISASARERNCDKQHRCDGAF